MLEDVFWHSCSAYPSFTFKNPLLDLGAEVSLALSEALWVAGLGMLWDQCQPWAGSSGSPGMQEKGSGPGSVHKVAEQMSICRVELQGHGRGILKALSTSICCRGRSVGAVLQTPHAEISCSIYPWWLPGSDSLAQTNWFPSSARPEDPHLLHNAKNTSLKTLGWKTLPVRSGWKSPFLCWPIDHFPSVFCSLVSIPSCLCCSTRSGALAGRGCQRGRLEKLRSKIMLLISRCKSSREQCSLWPICKQTSCSTWALFEGESRRAAHK